MERGVWMGLRTKLDTWKRRTQEIKVEAHAVYLASKDPRVPWHAKLLALFVIGYLFSPIDLIPDFIPVGGYLDDLLIVPAGLLIVMKLIPQEVLAEHREAARATALEKKPNWVAAGVIVAIWVVFLLLSVHFIIHRLK
jgi:uncharacterized membrane protein YkvA (DUF1232 family)